MAGASECIFLKGNHEQIAIKCLSDRRSVRPVDAARRHGDPGISTGLHSGDLANGKPIVQLQSAFHDALPQAHFRFFRICSNSFACGDFFFAHAGVRPDVELSHQKRERSALDQGGVSDFERRFRQDHRPWPHARARGRGRTKPDQYRYRCICDRSPDLPRDRRAVPVADRYGPAEVVRRLGRCGQRAPCLCRQAGRRCGCASFEGIVPGRIGRRARRSGPGSIFESASRLTAEEIASTVCSAKNVPERPSTTVSVAPPRPKAITGRPLAIASTGTIPKSSSPGKIKARHRA